MMFEIIAERKAIGMYPESEEDEIRSDELRTELVRLDSLLKASNREK